MPKGFRGFQKGEKHPFWGKKRPPFSDEWRRKISESRIGKKLSKETRRKIGLKSLGRKFSEETRKKISSANKGKKKHPFSDEHKKRMSEAHKGEKNYFYGKHHSEEAKQKIRNSAKGRKGVWRGKKLPDYIRKKISEARIGKYQGVKNPNWRGGIYPLNKAIRNSFEYKLWREAVFKKDNYTCIWCGQKGGKLNADHIKRFSDYPELRFAIDNGRTLCISCHKKTDNYGAKGLIGRKYKVDN